MNDFGHDFDAVIDARNLRRAKVELRAACQSHAHRDAPITARSIEHMHRKVRAFTQRYGNIVHFGDEACQQQRMYGVLPAPTTIACGMTGQTVASAARSA